MFMSNSVEAGACSAQICKVNSDIVQLRLVEIFIMKSPILRPLNNPQILPLSGWILQVLYYPIQRQGSQQVSQL